MQFAELSSFWSQMLHLLQGLANGPRTVMLYMCTGAPEAQCHGLKTGFILRSDQAETTKQHPCIKVLYTFVDP